MARNQEKANLMFNRWTTMSEEIGRGGPADRRPYLASECKNLSAAEKWRRQVINEITKRVADIQNAGLGEARIRDLNDEINKLLREKGHWERQIKALGGPDYTLNAPRLFDSADVLELPGSGGYKYFGAAKDLPGVKDLFSNAAAPERARRGRGQIAKGITPDYYGYRDEDDGVLVAAEASAERQLVTDAVEQWREGRAAAKRARVQAAPDSGAPGAGGLDSDSEGGDIDEASLAEEVSALSSAAFKAHVPLPQQAEIEGALLARKKALLLSKLAAQGAGAS